MKKCISIIFMLLSLPSYATDPATLDSTYINSYTGDLDLTTRLFSSVKYSRFWIRDTNHEEKISYINNENVILGIGISYKRYTFNLGLNFPFVNSDDPQKGSTKYIDAQGHYYLPSYLVDFWLSSYRGYRLVNCHDLLSQPSTSLCLRPDVTNKIMGVGILKIFNSEKYSFRACFTQDEWQKKSAGSFLLGFDLNASVVQGDSSLIPTAMKNDKYLEGFALKKAQIFTMGVGGGYAHTFVINQNFFIAFSSTVGIGLSNSTLFSDRNDQPGLNDLTYNWNVTSKAAIGYNSATYFIGLTGVNSWFTNKTQLDHGLLAQVPGNIRIQLIKRLRLNKALIAPILNKRK